MTPRSLLIDANNTNLKAEVDALKTVPGYCIFIDIVGSTALKQKNIYEWIASIHNAFSNTTMFLNDFSPLKGIGDELMYYIEESNLNQNSPLQLFDALFKIANETSLLFPSVKIVASYCTSVYAMTFIQGTNDYYGIDVDRAARLKQSCIKPILKEKEVIIDEQMYERVKSSYDKLGNKSDFTSFNHLQGPTAHKAKGIKDIISIYRTK
jgi:hypothetical protein